MAPQARSIHRTARLLDENAAGQDGPEARLPGRRRHAGAARREVEVDARLPREGRRQVGQRPCDARGEEHADTLLPLPGLAHGAGQRDRARQRPEA